MDSPRLPFVSAAAVYFVLQDAFLWFSPIYLLSIIFFWPVHLGFNSESHCPYVCIWLLSYFCCYCFTVINLLFKSFYRPLSCTLNEKWNKGPIAFFYIQKWNFFNAMDCGNYSSQWYILYIFVEILIDVTQFISEHSSLFNVLCVSLIFILFFCFDKKHASLIYNCFSI